MELKGSKTEKNLWEAFVLKAVDKKKGLGLEEPNIK